MSPAGPLFHMHEVSGEMTRIVKKFLHGSWLDRHEMQSLDEYVYQWVAAMPRKPPDYYLIRTMSQNELKTYYFETLLEWGVDPF